MKRILLFAMLVAAGLVASAWMGITDSRETPSRDAAQLNTAKKRSGLNDGEVLIWSPNMGSPPPGTPPAHLQNGQVYRATPTPVAGPQTSRMQSGAAYASALAPDYTNNHFYAGTRSLLPLARPLGSPRAGEWRSQVQEPEQNFGRYLAEARIATGSIVIQPIGDLPQDQKRAIGHLMDALSAFYGMPAICATPIPLSKLPSTCFRNMKGTRQLNAEAVMRQVLKPSVGGNVASIIAVTSLGLYPGESWPFDSTFGWSSFDFGTAIISTSRILEQGEAYKGKNLLRLCKLGSHELAHTFGLRHCSSHLCLLNGSGGLRESDAKPIALCPDCLAKLSVATGREPAIHLEDMLGLCKAKGFSSESRYYQSAIINIKM